MDKKEIRFIDSRYNELFRIPDGCQILITTPEGDKIRATCKYIDEYHTDVDGRCYHICQWAELNERNGRTYVPAEPPEHSLDTQTFDKTQNIKFVEENFGAVNQDKFFKTDYGFEEIYYNPDSTAGGQLVYNEFSFELIREASKQDSIEKFFEYLNSNCKQSLMDIDSPEFMDYLKEFMEQDADYLKDDKETANAMIKAANEDKKQSKTEPER